MHSAAQSCLTLCNPMDYSPPGLLCPWDSPGKNTGVGCHFLHRGSSRPKDWTMVSCVSCIGGQILLPLRHLENSAWSLVNISCFRSFGRNRATKSYNSCLWLDQTSERGNERKRWKHKTSEENFGGWKEHSRTEGLTAMELDLSNSPQYQPFQGSQTWCNCS